MVRPQTNEYNGFLNGTGLLLVVDKHSRYGLGFKV